jgi:hypothetical protein
MVTSVSTIHVFQCWQSLVNQTAVVDAQTGNATLVEPDIKKNASTWLPSAPPYMTTPRNVFLSWVSLRIPLQVTPHATV